jgi:hypothetical protein
MNLEDYLINGKLRSYTAIGAYPLTYLTASAVLCPQCASANLRAVTIAAINWEDPDLYCDECGDRVESAYAESDRH